MIKRTLKCPVYNCTVHFVFGTDKDAFNYFNKTMPNTDWLYLKQTYREGEAGTAANNGNSKAVFYLFLHEDYFTLSALVHETRHLTDLILEEKGVVEKWEAPAYYQEYWFNRLLSLIDTKTAIQSLRQLKK